MSALDFPSSPTNGQTYTANGVTFVYDSTVGAWEGTLPSEIRINADGGIPSSIYGGINSIDGGTV